MGAAAAMTHCSPSPQAASYPAHHAILGAWGNGDAPTANRRCAAMTGL